MISPSADKKQIRQVAALLRELAGLQKAWAPDGALVTDSGRQPPRAGLGELADKLEQGVGQGEYGLDQDECRLLVRALYLYNLERTDNVVLKWDQAVEKLHRAFDRMYVRTFGQGAK